MPFFPPSVDQASECRKAMQAALWQSAASLLRADYGDTAITLDGWAKAAHPARMLDFGAYFDIAMAHPALGELPGAIKQDAADHFASLAGASPAGAPNPARAEGETPHIVNLSRAHFSASAIERLTRWWDIEPENAMDMGAVPQAQFDHASACITHAFAMMQQCAPALHGEITTLIGEIVTAGPNGEQLLDFGGVSSFSLWGGFVINAGAAPDWPAYYQTVVHESAHNLLFGIARNEPLVLDAPDAKGHSPLREQLRPLDGIYHAAFVSARESLALDQLLGWHEKTGGLDEAELARAEDLLDSSVGQFWSCADTVAAQATLSPLGQTILDECREFMTTHFAFAES